MRFESVVELGGKTATGIPVPDAVVEELASGKRPAVRITVGNHTYRTTVAPRGGRLFVPLAAEHRVAAGLTAGDAVVVEIALDVSPRTVDLPDDLAAALAEAGMRDRFDALSYSHRKEHVRAIEEAKKPETRARRVTKAVEMVAALRR